MSAVDHCSGHLSVEVVDPLICHDPQVVFYGVKQIVQGEYPDWGASSEPFAVDEFMNGVLREHFLQQWLSPPSCPAGYCSMAIAPPLTSSSFS